MRAPLAVAALSLLGVAWAGGAAPWTLERAIDRALQANPDAEIARHRLASAQAGLEQANAAFQPRLQFRTSYGVTDNPMLAFGSILNQRSYSSSLDFNNVPDIDNLNVKGLLTMPLYTGGRNSASRSAARAQAGAAREDTRTVRNALVFEVSRIFYTIQKTRDFVRAAEAAVGSIDSSLEIAKKRLAAGTVLKTDVLDLEVRQAEALETLTQARNANVLAIRQLRNLLGLEDEAEFAVAEVTVVPEAPVGRDSSGRSELAAARLREQAAASEVQAVRSGYKPQVSAFGSLDYDYGWKNDKDGTSYTVGALLQWDLWDGRQTRSKVRGAEADLEAARAEERKVRLAVDLETEAAALALKAANERLKVTEKAVAQAAESLELTRSRFDQGTALATQVIDAETALLAARVRRAESQADQRIAIAALNRALGLAQDDVRKNAGTP